MQNITENLRKTNITVSLHEKNNIYQAVINYKDDNNKRKFKKSYITQYEEYVCLKPDGSLIKPDYVTRHFPLLLKNSGLRHIRFHDLRHSCAINLITFI